ncbi:MAG: hypothetical protein RLY71_3423, partial [Pseudomonadota bacterium]
MSVMLHETWTALDGRLVFEFSIPARAAADDVCLVRVLDSTMPAGAITLEIHGSQPCTCSCRFETGLRVQGSLCRVPDVHVDDRRCIGIRAELYFGLPTQIDDIRFEGLMVACPVPGHTRPFVPEPSALPVADAPPVSDVLLAPSDCVAAWPGADAPEPALPVRIDSRLTDLFPYVWTRRWPQTEPADLRDGFVQFSPSRWPDCPFWETLVAARAQGRVAVQAAALRFISGRAAGSSDFVASLGQIVGPVRRFAALAQLLVALDAGSPTWPAQVARKIASVLRHEHETVAYFGSPAYQRVLDRVWQSYFATLITLGWNPALRAGLQRVLWVAHLVDRVLVLDPPSPAGEVPAVQALTAEQIQLLHGASILLPEPVFPLPSAGGAQASPPAGHVPGWVEPYAIGDLQMVRQRLLRYRTGEVARIENIMPGERREVSHRRSRQQLDQVQLQSSDGEHFQDEGGDKRSDLLEAVRKTVAEQSVTQHYQDFKTSYGPPTQATLDGQWTRTTKPGTEAGLQDLTRFAREVLDKTVHRIHRSISQQRIRSTLDQHEEEVRSTVDNTNNAHGRNVVYRWLNEVHEAQVVHYGRRLMLEFVLNRPAA